MTPTPTQPRITRLEFKSEGENDEGMVIGTLTDQDGRNVFPGEQWVTKQEALRVARGFHIALEEF
jgi:hypothetical protein